MLNGYAFQKRLEEYKETEVGKDKKQRLQNKHVQTREELAQQYKYRVDKFIQDVRQSDINSKQMSQEPVMIKNYQPNVTYFRPKEDRSKMLGDALIRTKSFVTEKVRIQESIQHYRDLLDTEATVNKKMVPEFRERDISKEIQPKMRFTASTQLERIIDVVNQQRNGNDLKGLKKNNNARSLSDMIVQSMKNNLLDALQKEQNMKIMAKQSANPTQESTQINLNLDSPDIPKQTKQEKRAHVYSSTSSSRLRIVSSRFVTENIKLIKEFNKHYKKLHFKATQSVQMGHPGSLQQTGNHGVNIMPNSQTQSPNQSVHHEGESPYSTKGFINKLDSNKNHLLQATKSSFFLPANKKKLNKESTFEFKPFSQSTTNMNFKSNFELPQVVNPIQISKQKQQQMTEYLESKSKNPYDMKNRKGRVQSLQERQKIDALMSASYMDSSFYNMFYKNSHIANKKLRFASNQPMMAAGGGDEDISNFGLDPQSLEDPMKQPKVNIKSALKQLQGIAKSKKEQSLAHLDSMAGDVLTNCNAVNNKIGQAQVLKKGDGKITSGSGLTNFQVYNNLLKTF